MKRYACRVMTLERELEKERKRRIRHYRSLSKKYWDEKHKVHQLKEKIAQLRITIKSLKERRKP